MNGVFSYHRGRATEEEAVEILKGLRPYYEKHHGVEILDEAIEAAVKMSVRYINDRFLPDKAIDIIDEAASKYNWRDIVRLRKQKPWKEKSTIF